MDKFLIYINYDQFEYINYFHLAINDNLVIEYRPEEKVDDLFETIIEKESVSDSFELCVVQDKDALEWNCFKAFQKYGIETYPKSNKDLEKLCRVMNLLFNGEYVIDGKDYISNKQLINILYFGNCVLQRDNFETGETLKQAEEILKHGGEEMTELARIIREKYERMNRYE